MACFRYTGIDADEMMRRWHEAVSKSPVVPPDDLSPVILEPSDEVVEVLRDWVGDDGEWEGV
jgi:hypothetical protein